MNRGVNIDGVLVTWGDRLFYPGTQKGKGSDTPRLRSDALHRRAAWFRARIAAAVARRAPQVMVKVTGGGRCMRAIAAHFRYISKNGRLEVEDDRGETLIGRQAVKDLSEDWRYSGGLIPEASPGIRREALNIMLSMPRGTDPLGVQRAAREFARAELAGHKYVMVLHDHQANPHVHISVLAQSREGSRLNPRKADLQRWRVTFAAKLAELGIEAEASGSRMGRVERQSIPLWKLKALEAGRLRQASVRRQPALDAWLAIASVLDGSDVPGDHQLALAVRQHVGRTRGSPEHVQQDIGRGRG